MARVAPLGATAAHRPGAALPAGTVLNPQDLRETRRLLGELRDSHLTATVWSGVSRELTRLAAAIEHDDADALRSALVAVSRASFEGKVRGRLGGGGQRAAMVVATKPTSALPAVGALSAALLIGMGYLLGGWVVAGLTAVFAVFILAVALAGTRTLAERSGGHPPAASAELDHRVAMPEAVAAAVADVEARLR